MSDKLKVSKVESKGYGIIYKLPMQDKDLDVVAKAFYAYICSYAGAGDTAFPTIDKICFDLNVSRQRLLRHRKALEEKGYITVTKVTNPNGTFKHNEYKINKELEPTLQNPPMDEPTLQNPPMDNVTTNKNIYNNNIINNKDIKTLPQQVEGPSNNQLEEQFDQWYSFYPKKVNKKKAFDKFKLKVKKHGFEKIFEGMTAYAKVMELNGTDKQFIKGPDVFLNGEHYLDDQSELLKQKPDQQQSYKPWEELAYGTETNSSNYDDYSKQLPNTTKQIGW